ncbi:MAG TPA: hypothetical protein VFQ94_03000 [Gallionella sp.]|nr:hypothetical protein [Gallionella sp.]
MDDFVAFLRDWKELIGAVIGGIFSLLVALLVAYQARRSEEKTAATLLIGEFLRVHAMVHYAGSRVQEQELTPEQQSHLLAERLCRFRVKLSPLFDASIARVMHCDVYLAGTMVLASSLIRDTEPVLERLGEDVAALHRGEQPKRNEATIDADINVVTSGYELIALHSQHSARLLETIVLSAFPSWHKLRRRLAPTEPDQQLFALLKRGRA